MEKKNHSIRTNKSKKILNHLQTNGSITSWEAIENYGATRLSAIIYNLRKRYVIDSTDRIFTDKYGDTSTFTTYIYRGELTDTRKAGGEKHGIISGKQLHSM